MLGKRGLVGTVVAVNRMVCCTSQEAASPEPDIEPKDVEVGTGGGTSCYSPVGSQGVTAKTPSSPS